MREILNFDWILLVVIVVLTSFGLIIGNTIAPNLLLQQGIYIGLGFLIFFIFFKIDFRFWLKIAPYLFLISLLFLITPFIFGFVSRGAVRWLKIGPFSLQPSEIVKPFLIIFFAWFFSQGKELKRIFLGLILVLIPFFLVFFQPDLGSAVLFLIFWLGIIWISGGDFKFFLGGAVFFLASLPLIWRFFLKGYQKERILSFVDPFSDPTGRGYNLIQAIIAIGSGRFLGRGIKGGTQSQLRFLPEAHTDFIFASWAETFGFLGVIFLLFFYFILFWRILKIMEEIENKTVLNFLGGAFSLIFFQVLINIGMNLGLLPIVGITLPLVSYGGSSYLSTMMILGIIQNICYNKHRYE
ncbi:MAG: rod shape-determining protein RodA [Microgenomates group bacterium]